MYCCTAVCHVWLSAHSRCFTCHTTRLAAIAALPTAGCHHAMAGQQHKNDKTLLAFGKKMLLYNKSLAGRPSSCLCLWSHHFNLGYLCMRVLLYTNYFIGLLCVTKILPHHTKYPCNCMALNSHLPFWYLSSEYISMHSGCCGQFWHPHRGPVESEHWRKRPPLLWECQGCARGCDAGPDSLCHMPFT